MLKKLDLIQCGIILVMLVFFPFKGTYPILFTIGGWLGTVGILVGFISVRMINKMERNKEHSLRMSNICINMSLLNSVGYTILTLFLHKISVLLHQFYSYSFPYGYIPLKRGGKMFKRT